MIENSFVELRSDGHVKTKNMMGKTAVAIEEFQQSYSYDKR